MLYNVTCRPVVTERVDKQVSVEMDSWIPRRRFRGYRCSTGVSVDTDTPFRSECSQLQFRVEFKEYNGVQWSSEV
jgi:hypothetical protein